MDKKNLAIIILAVLLVSLIGYVGITSYEIHSKTELQEIDSNILSLGAYRGSILIANQAIQNGSVLITDANTGNGIILDFNRTATIEYNKTKVKD